MLKPLLTAIPLALALSGAAHSEEKEMTMTEPQTAVLKAVETMTANLESGDLAGVMASYEPGAAILFEPGQPVTDASVSEAIFKELAAVNPEVTYAAGHEVYIAGDIAVHIAPWSLIGKAPDGSPVEQAGLSVAVLRQQADGNWKLVIDNPHGGRLLAE